MKQTTTNERNEMNIIKKSALVIKKTPVETQHQDLKAYVNPRNGRTEVLACPKCGTFKDYISNVNCDSSRPNPIINGGWIARAAILPKPKETWLTISLPQ